MMVFSYALAALVAIAAAGVVFGAPADTKQFPSGYAYGCVNMTDVKAMPFCDATRPVEERLEDLINRLSLGEKMGLLGGANFTHVGSCNMMDAGVARLGIPPFMHLVETNTGAASACHGPEKCATTFAGPTGLAASFNRTMWRAKGEIISTELRALNNLRWHRKPDAPYSLIAPSGFGPNINQPRDPRFGRTSELPGEDPLLSGTYAVEYVRGCQEGEDAHYLKMVAGLKHFDAYSCENNRAGRSFNISAYDLWDTYLPQYEMAFRRDGGNAGQVMCSYASVNGVPSCASDFLLNRVVRGLWAREDVVVASDCGAVTNMVQHNHYAADDTDAATKSMLGGLDLDLGDMYFSPVAFGGNGALERALRAGRVSEARVTESVRRMLRKRFAIGQFDPLAGQRYASLDEFGAAAINSSAHQALNLDATLQSMVLLKNEAAALPLTPGRQLAVIGPHALSQRDLLSGYFGDQVCAADNFECVPTLASMLTRANAAAGPAGLTTVDLGVDMDSPRTSGIAAAVANAERADAVVLCLGIGHNQEHEGIDRTQITLPGQQQALALAVASAARARGVPVVLVLVNGGVVAVDNLIPHVNAIVEAFYPSLRGGEALARLLFGADNRWGKLPVTMFAANIVDQLDMYSFDMRKAPGRTYRYFTGTPLFEFGHGLSYTTFATTCTATSPVRTITCDVRNTGARDGDEVVQVYHHPPPHTAGSRGNNGDHDNHETLTLPIKQLVGFERVHVPKGSTARVVFHLTESALRTTDADGAWIVLPGSHTLTVSRGFGRDASFVENHAGKLLRVNPLP